MNLPDLKLPDLKLLEIKLPEIDLLSTANQVLVGGSSGMNGTLKLFLVFFDPSIPLIDIVSQTMEDLKSHDIDEEIQDPNLDESTVFAMSRFLAIPA